MDRYGQTDIHPLALMLTLTMGVAMLLVKRDRAAIPVLIVACMVTHAQRIVVGGLDFSMLRLMILFGWVRVFLRGEARDYRFHPVDAALPIWQVFATLAYVIGPRASLDGFVLRLGLTLDAAGMYFLFRVILRDVRDVQRTVGAFSWIALVMVGPMLIENLTGRNPFSVLGGVSEVTSVRGGRLRCRASFSHPIMAGNFGATSAALVAGLWLAFPKQRLRHTAALLASVGITVLAASGGPLMALAAAFLGWGLWPYRRYLRVVRWTALLGVVGLQMVMEKPVWHLLGRLSRITGGTGWHRVKLIDGFVEHFDEWWLWGTASTEHWKLGAASSDVTNQYIIEGVRGGLPALLSFLGVLVLAFRGVGECLRRVKARRSRLPPEARRTALLAWGLGVCLLVHCVAFIGVAYFGQLMAIFYLHLALVPSLVCALSRVQSMAVAPVASRSPRDAEALAPAAPAPGTSPSDADDVPSLARPLRGRREPAS